MPNSNFKIDDGKIRRLQKAVEDMGIKAIEINEVCLSEGWWYWENLSQLTKDQFLIHC